MSVLRPIFVGFFLAACLLTALVAAPRAIQPDDAHLRYVGRFDFGDPAGPRCAWSASRVELRVAGSGRVGVRLAESNRALWQVVINGEAAGVISSRGPAATYVVAEDLPAGEHTIFLVRRTEFNTGGTQILGFEIDDVALLLPPVPRSRVIEVIGDSISCGYGNEAASQAERYTAETQNAWLTYGAITAERLNADYVCVAWSGKKLWPNNTIVEYYDHVLMSPSAAKWDFARFRPDAVVINLGTNDFARENPDADGWVAAARDFIRQVRRNYPSVPVFFCVGPMLSDRNASCTPRTVMLGYLQRVVEETRGDGAPVHIIDFGIQQMTDWIGADWHPSVDTHRKMADTLTAALRSELGW
ncbi:MAG: SGNH/GDSL hydrolase family protein [Verrucomicrobiota bacterium]